MNDIRDLVLGIPDDTAILGVFVIRDVDQDGYHYNTADSKVFMVNGVDGIDVVEGVTYSLDENGEWHEFKSPALLSEEEIESRHQLEEDLKKLDEEGAPSTEGGHDDTVAD